MNSVSLVEELGDQELSRSDGARAGGIWTIPGTKTIGAFCTISYECWGFVCNNG